MVYKWIGADGGWKVGTMVQAKDSPLFIGQGQYRLMRHSHTLELEWVREGQLSAYHSQG